MCTDPGTAGSGTVRACPVDDEGATAVEYALIAVLVAAVIAAIVGTVGQQLLGLFTTASNGFP